MVGPICQASLARRGGHPAEGRFGQPCAGRGLPTKRAGQTDRCPLPRPLLRALLEEDLEQGSQPVSWHGESLGVLSHQERWGKIVSKIFNLFYMFRLLYLVMRNNVRLGDMAAQTGDFLALIYSLVDSVLAGGCPSSGASALWGKVSQRDGWRPPRLMSRLSTQSPTTASRWLAS